MAKSTKEDSRELTITLSYHEHTGHFFINFASEVGIIISQKITAAQAVGLSNELNIKILQ